MYLDYLLFMRSLASSAVRAAENVGTLTITKEMVSNAGPVRDNLKKFQKKPLNFLCRNC